MIFDDGDLRLKKNLKKVKINLVVSIICCIFVIQKETNKQQYHETHFSRQHLRAYQEGS